MGLTLFTYLAAAIMIFMALQKKHRGRGPDTRTFRLAALLSAAYAICLATGYFMAESYQDTAVTLLRWAAALAVASYIAFFRLSLTYPYAKRVIPVDIALVALVGTVIWRIVFTSSYLEQVRRTGLEYIRLEGPEYSLFSIAGAAIGMLAVIVFFARAIPLKSRVYRQQLFVISTSILGSIVYGFIIAIYLPQHGFNTIYPIGGLSGLIAVLGVNYAFSSTRLFHTPTVIKTVASRLAILVLFAAPLGFLLGVLMLFRLSMPLVVLAVSAASFLLFGRWADTFAQGRFGSARDEEAREEIEASIAHLDLSTGREDVLGKLAGIMADEFGSSWFSVLSEDDAGGLSRVYPGKEEVVVAMPDSPAIATITSLERSIILKTDVVADPEFALHKTTLLEFIESVSAEAIILAREGRRIVGVFLFGPKRSGADYDALDYKTFQAIYGKLFVVAYYVRHVAREELLDTVEKEIGLADQIVRSMQESIDPIIHPSVDASFICRSTRQLGGDLFDSVRISDDRWFFVVGDVSGKGLNASMSMVILKSMIRTLLREEKDFIKLVSRTNTFIKDHLPRGTFFAGVFGFVALDKGSVYFLNCGIPAIFFRSSGLDTIVEVQGDGKMLGFVRDLEPFLKTRKLALPPGSGLVISTDGIIEAENIRGERYGKEKLVRIIAENKGAGAQEIVDAVLKSANAFTDNKLEDDITMFAINFHGRKEKKS
ncbi:MAG: serine/threonine-protein phosphatase [Spirochaetales bacterium]|nr:MAG: serine/threonine-protein phosphatase [Spirochaetales bacterium]